MRTMSLTDVRAQLSTYVEQVVRMHERTTIARDGGPAAVLISAEDLEAVHETLYGSSQPRVEEDGDSAGLDEVLGDPHSRKHDEPGPRASRR